MQSLTIGTNQTENINVVMSSVLNELVPDGGPELHLDLAPELPRDVTTDVARTFITILRQAVSNAVRHAHAAHIWVRTQYDIVGRVVILEVKDDGEGFDLDKDPALTSHGLSIMTRAARSLGATPDIQSSDGLGTRIRCCIPIEEETQDDG